MPIHRHRGSLKRPNSRKRAWPAAASEFAAAATAYLEWLAVRHYARPTLLANEQGLLSFAVWAAARGVTRPGEVTLVILEQYQRYLHHYRKSDGRPMSAPSQNKRLVPLRGFFRWLVRQHWIGANPAADLLLARVPQRLPGGVLTVAAVERVLALPELAEPLGVRDRTMLEVLYSTGIRRKELVHLQALEVDFLHGTLMVRQGKGNKDRVVPIGERALAWVNKYLLEVRPQLEAGRDQGELFLTGNGEPLNVSYFGQLVGRYVRAALGQAGSCHLFRHTMATLMLENGADVRFIQALLGHEDLATTALYTHVSIAKLKQIHTATHPGAKLGPKASDPAAEEEQAIEQDRLVAAHLGPGVPEPT